MNKVFIISQCKFPNGSALSHYLLYMALAIKSGGYETYLLTDLNTEYYDESTSEICYKEINVKNILPNEAYGRYSLCEQRKIYLEEKEVGRGDVIIAFDYGCYFHNMILKMKKERFFAVVLAELEMFEAKDYEGDALKQEEAYQKRQYIRNYYAPQYEGILGISSFICKVYREKGMKALCLPPLVSSKEYELMEKDRNKIRFIIPSMGKMKDDFETMLRAFSGLPKEDLEKCELHICGVDEATIKETLGSEMFHKAVSFLVIHQWMKYEELISLYKEIHFLLLARKQCQMNFANFPSKVPEAMNLGIVPIVSDVGDYTKYYLRNGIDSFIMNESSVDECKIFISRAINLSAAQYMDMSNNAKCLVMEKFDFRVWTSVIKKYFELL